MPSLSRSVRAALATLLVLPAGLLAQGAGATADSLFEALQGRWQVSVYSPGTELQRSEMVVRELAPRHLQLSETKGGQTTSSELLFSAESGFEYRIGYRDAVCAMRGRLTGDQLDLEPLPGPEVCSSVFVPWTLKLIDYSRVRVSGTGDAWVGDWTR